MLGPFLVAPVDPGRCRWGTFLSVPWLGPLLSPDAARSARGSAVGRCYGSEKRDGAGNESTPVSIQLQALLYLPFVAR